MPVDKKEVIRDYFNRKFGRDIDHAQFDAIYEAAVAHHIWGEELSSELICSIIEKHAPSRL